jgi:DNA-directed RNA polymerase subunit F
MIKNSEPLSLAESLEYIKKDDDKETEIVGFIKKFNKLKSKDAREMKQDIDRLGIIKIRQEHSVKIVDILPESAEELNKIFADVSLDDDETKKVLDTVKRYR